MHTCTHGYSVNSVHCKEKAIEAYTNLRIYFTINTGIKSRGFVQKMRCCLSILFFLAIITFVQIRLRQERDSLHFPKKFFLQYRVQGSNDMPKKSVVLNVTQERVLYGKVESKIKNNEIHLNQACVLKAYLTIRANPLMFHTVKIKSGSELYFSATALTDEDGVGYLYATHTFHHLNPSFSVSHHGNGGLVNVENTPVRLDGIVELQNIHYMVEEASDSKWVPL